MTEDVRNARRYHAASLPRILISTVAVKFQPSVDPFLDTEVIDERAPRTNQAVVAFVTGLAFVLDFPPLVTLMAAQLILGLTLGRRWCLSCWF